MNLVVSAMLNGKLRQNSVPANHCQNASQPSDEKDAGEIVT
jgi:hypothetical protein